MESTTEKRRAAQSFPLVTGLFHDPLVVHGISQGARSLLGYLTFLIWKNRDLRIRASAKFLKDNTGQSVSSVKRHLAELIDLRLVHFERHGTYPQKTPNWFLIEPLFLAEFDWKGRKATEKRAEVKPLANLERSLFFNMVQKGPCGSVEYWEKIENMVQKEPSLGSKRTMWEKISGTNMVQKELQIYIIYSFLCSRAPRHCPKNDRAVQQGTLEIEVPFGLVQTAKQKGVARAGDSIEEIGRRNEARAKKSAAQNRL